AVPVRDVDEGETGVRGDGAVQEGVPEARGAGHDCGPQAPAFDELVELVGGYLEDVDQRDTGHCGPSVRLKPAGTGGGGAGWARASPSTATILLCVTVNAMTESGCPLWTMTAPAALLTSASRTSGAIRAKVNACRATRCDPRSTVVRLARAVPPSPC